MPRLPQDQSKCREWEKDRRNRLNDAFNALGKLLPCYDPAVTISKVDILLNAATHIEDLQQKIKGLMTPEISDSAKKVIDEEIKKLQERVKRLLSKNEQLCILLREAKIAIPNGRAAVRKFKSPLYWSEKIPPEKIKMFQKKELNRVLNNKENDVKKARKIVNKVKTKSASKPGTPKHRKVILNRPSRKKAGKTEAPSKCLIVLSQPSMSQPCYVITKAPTNNMLGNTSTVLTNSGLLSNPVVSSNVKALKCAPSSVPVLGPGTLILANGAMVPVLPRQTVLPLATQIINPLHLSNNKPPTVILLPNKSSRQIIQSSTSSSSSTSVSSGGAPIKTLAKIRPKYCLTRTTQVNKVPIPALTSRYATKDLTLVKPNKNEVKTVKTTKSDDNKKNKSEEPTVVETAEKRKLSNAESVDNKKTRTIPENVEKSSVETEKQDVAEIEKNEANVDKNKPESETNSKTPVLDKETLLDLAQAAPEIVEECPTVSKSTESDKSKPEAEVANQEMKALELNINHSELSNDIFASLQVPTGCQNPESTSPTAAFLLAFPLVSSLVKVAEVTEDDNTESQRGTPNLLQIGTMDSTKPTQSESLTPSLMNLDNLSFFSKDICNSLYSSFDNSLVPTTTTVKVTESVSLQRENNALSLPPAVDKSPKFDFIQQSNNQELNIQPQHQNSQQTQQHQQQKRVNYNHHFDAQILPATTQSSLPNTSINFHMKTNNNNKVSLSKNVDNKVCSNYNLSQRNNYQNSNNFVTTTAAMSSYSTSVIKSYPDPLYTNSNSYYSYPTDNNFNQNYYKNITKNDNSRSYNYSLSYENYSDYRKSDNNQFNYYTNNCSKDKFATSTTTLGLANNKSKPINNQTSRAPINWMTDNRTDYVLPQFSKEGDFGHNSIYSGSNFVANSVATTNQSYFNANPSVYTHSNDLIANNNQEVKKSLDLPLAPPTTTYHHHNQLNHQSKSTDEDNQFSWSSPSKMPQFLDPAHSFVSSTLPTLVGDLALGNPLTFNTSDQKKKIVDNNNSRRIKNYENGGNQGNFLSVSQLVDHNKSEPARAAVRRNSGGRSNKKMQLNNKQTNRNKSQENKAKQVYGNSQDLIRNNSSIKNTSSNYSAEALIGHQLVDNQNGGKNNSNNNHHQQQHNQQQNYNNKLPVPPFLGDNIIPYFPPVDLQQDNNYIHHQQNHQNYHHHQNFGHNFSTSFHQNNSYTPNTFIPTATTITSTYNFIPEMGMSSATTITNDYGDNLNLFPPPSINKDKSLSCTSTSNNNILTKGNNNNHRIGVNNNPVANNSKKVKRKQLASNEGNNLPNLVDFSFLSMPGAINSPILPDDFHSHSGFLQPPTPQLYPCKNPFKQNDLTSGGLLPLPPVPAPRTAPIQHPEISPSINSAGTSLTNFNLSTIFPEINKGALSEPYLEPRIKEHPRSYSSTSQVPFNDKPNFSFSYINCATTQYNNQ